MSLKEPVPTATQQPSEFPSPPTVPSAEPRTHSYGTRRKSLGARKKQLGRKGVHSSHSTIPIEEGDPEAEHKMCIKYASNADSASDDDTPINLYLVVDWEDHLAEGVGLVLWGDLKVLIDSPEVNDGSDVLKNQNTWNIQSWKLYTYSGVHVLETVDGLVLHMFVDKQYPLSANLIERMLDHQLEICQGTMGNELTTAVQLIAFLKKQLFDSRRPKAIRLESIESSMDLTLSGPRLDVDFLVADSKFMKVAFGVGFKMIVVPSSGIVTTSRYVVPTGRVKVPAGRYVVPTGKDNVIVSAGRTKVIPAGRTILVLVVLCLLRVDSIVS
ncbi:hypothetical protein Tco_0979236 [Tanacetum coccineum]